ncbi:zona pellucida-like domain protein [Dictyocaulus viviparus]|uniref:Zona pellucida-like domain protein n=1 Tax=Dictyocaulus viviparus TaxID=29172 RepID=A0A0D8X9H4_DICVI|nr:zona pellucida-like domain protein [Dictyocaulus viviparus]
MFWQFFRVWIILVSTTITIADIIDNGLVVYSGEPVIECGSETLGVRFTTQSPFEGHVYVKGHYWIDDCRSDASFEKTANLTVDFATCDVLRQRSNHPKGLVLTSTVIISFHPMFVTKIDKSYRVQCFYAEETKAVTQNLNVSEGNDMQRNVLVIIGDEEATSEGKPSNVLHDDVYKVTEDTLTAFASLPECRYQASKTNSIKKHVFYVFKEQKSSVLDGGKNGNPVKFASVGQLVYHEWSCDPEGKLTEDSPFCATVHSCSVKEDGGREVLLLDENGCAVDRYLLNNLEYTSNLRGGQISQVFKFADQPSLFFQCQIRLSLKEGDICKRSSDNCPRPLRGKRSTEQSDSENNVDVVSQYMTVFDIDGPTNNLPTAQSLLQKDICLSPLTAGFLFTVLIFSILICILSISISKYWQIFKNSKI